MQTSIPKKPVLLVADDQPDNLKVIKDILSSEEEKYILITVPNGKILVDIAKKKLPDLIITDWEMPEMDGLAAIRILKEEETTKDIPILMYTGIMTSPKHLQIALEAGAIDFIRKPLEATELIARVQSMLHLADSYRQIKAQKEDLEALNAVKNRLISIISHDVRNPLNALKGILMLFQYNALSQEELQEITKSVGNQVGQITFFLDNLLRWVNTHQNSVVPTFEKLSVQQVVDETVALLAFIAQTKKINIEVSIADGLNIYADSEMIKVVVRNLLSNALKFCDENDIVSIIAEAEGGMASIMVKDTGQGISPDVLPTLFSINHLSTRGTKDEIGTGVGLTLCKEFVEKHKGTLAVTSVEGHGSCFTFTVPLGT